MKFKCILDGTASDARAQAEELNGFLKRCLPAEAGRGGCILFHTRNEDQRSLVSLAPTQAVELVRVDRYAPEIVLEALQRIEDQRDTQLYLFPAGFAGAELAVRWAFRRQGSSLVQAEQVALAGDRLVAKKKAYAGHALAIFQLNRPPYCISPARGSAGKLAIETRDNRKVVEHRLTGLDKEWHVRASRCIPAEKTADIGDGKLLIVGGRGLGSRKNVMRLKETARAMGAEFGISRPVALNAWEDLQRLIGVSGTIARPKICIAAGVSGAAAFYAGIEKSRLIIAINLDPHARIVKAADVAVVDDWKAVMDELLKFFKPGAR